MFYQNFFVEYMILTGKYKSLTNEQFNLIKHS